MHRPYLKIESGFSLIETVLALGLGLGLLAFVKDPLMSTLQLNALTKDENAWQNLENDLRRSVLDNALFAIAQKQNPVLDHCLQADDLPCPAGRHPVHLYLSEKRLSTGPMAAPGIPCTGSPCALEVQATFNGVCRTTVACDAVGAVEFDYRILVAGKVFRQGYLQRNNKVKNIVDENQACQVDDLGRSGFAQSIGPTSIGCLAAPRLNRKVSGIELGDCLRGRELLVGFDAGGKRICEAIKRAAP